MRYLCMWYKFKEIIDMLQKELLPVLADDDFFVDVRNSVQSMLHRFQIMENMYKMKIIFNTHSCFCSNYRGADASSQ